MSPGHGQTTMPAHTAHDIATEREDRALHAAETARREARALPLARTLAALVLEMFDAGDCDDVAEAIASISTWDRPHHHAAAELADLLCQLDENHDGNGWSQHIGDEDRLYACWAVGLLATEPEPSRGYVRWDGFSTTRRLRANLEA